MIGISGSITGSVRRASQAGFGAGCWSTGTRWPVSVRVNCSAGRVSGIVVSHHKVRRSQAQAASIASVDRSISPTQAKKPWFMSAYRASSTATPASRSVRA